MNSKNESQYLENTDEGHAMKAINGGQLPPLNLVHVLEDAAHQFPDRVALYFSRADASPTRSGEGHLTFAELEEKVSRLAAGFHSRGVGKSDRVLVMIPMSQELYVVVLALMKLAATAVFVEPFMGLNQMLHYCQMSEPKALVTTPKGHLLRLFPRALHEVSLKFVTSEVPLPGAEAIQRLARENVPEVRTEAPDEDAPALINFTSGSRGQPRAVNRTHSHLWAQHIALAEAFPSQPGDVDMSAFPIFPLHSLASGVTAVLPARFSGIPAKVVPEAVVKQIHDCGATTIKGPPAFYEPIARYCAARGITLKTVRALLTGGAPVHPELVGFLRRLVPNGEVYVAYGSTEAEPIAGISGAEILAETGELTKQGRGICVGSPLGSIAVRVIKCLEGPVDLQRGVWNSILLPKGVPGELVVAGQHVNETYFRNPQAVAETKFRDEIGRVWHRTDDVGYFDASGRLWLVGRTSTRVLRADRELHPLQIEPVVNTLKFVKRCALLGIQDAVVGQRAVLIVAPKSGSLPRRLTKARHWKTEIRELCWLQDFPVDEILFKRVIPLDRRRNAKVDYEKLRTWYYRPALFRFMT
jgi:acyl-CoA synthetase (AMP-forming)/AMP-acid ligase II